MCTPRYMEAGVGGRVPHGSVLCPTLYNLHINDTSQLLGEHLSFFADDG
jgi:hypothetical protein